MFRGYLGVTFPRSMAPWSEAAFWFPVALTGMDGNSPLAGTLLHDTFKELPQVLTVMTVFTIAWQLGAAKRRDRVNLHEALSHSRTG